MTQLFFYIVPVAVILGFMIFIHELGHFMVAKALGVRVEQFAIGFGKRLIGFRKGETDYRINAIPLGGYVKMSGENPMDDRTGDPAEFMSHSRWHRFLIAIAGPTMNILLAIVLLTIVYRVHYEYPASKDEPAVIGYVEPDSPAAKIGVQRGDRIIQIADVQDPTWGDVMSKDLISPNQPLDVVIQRGSQRIEKQVVPEAVTVNEVGSAGWHPDEPVIVGSLESGMPAQKAGITEGDKIIAMDGQPVTSIESMIQSLQQTKDKPVNFTVVRGSQTLNLTIQPVLAPAVAAPQNRQDWFDRLLRRLGFGSNAAAHKTEDHYRIGFSYAEEMKVVSLPLPEAFSRSLADNRTNSLMLLDLVGKLVQGKISPKTISGPIGIAQVAGDAAQEKGWTPLIEITAMISLNLGIFNLLPFPIMDGGVILLLFIEAVMRRDISLQIKERIYQAAFVFLVLFATMVIYNDIAKTIAQRLP
jgi:regulator of sigma E protease